MPITLFLSFLLLIALLWGFFSIVIWSIYNGISPMPTSIKVKRKLFSTIPSLTNGAIYELGSGWGSLALPLAQQFPDHQIIGYETSPLPYFVSVLRQKLNRLKNLKCLRQNFFNAHLNEARLVLCYLYPKAMERLKSKLEMELKPGSWVISHTFAIPGWQPYQEFIVPDLYQTKIYIYKIKGEYGF